MEQQTKEQSAASLPAGVSAPKVMVSAKEFTRNFAKAAGIRAVRTMAQTAISLMGAKVLISDVDWKALLSAVVMSGICSILTSVATGLPETAGADISNRGSDSQ